MNAPLTKYDEARRALAEAHRVDEVLDITNKAIAMQVYAKQAKDRELIALATEIRKRAERRLGELLEQERQAGKLAKGGQPHQRKQKSTGSRKDPVAPTLAEHGIDKHLADRSRKAAALTEEAFEAQVAQTVRVAVAATEGAREDVKAARQAEKRARRHERELELAAKITALPEKKFGVLYANPPSRLAPDDSAEPDLDYPTMAIAAIKALPISAADDCVVFLWAPVPVLPAALDVMAAWGFAYESLVVWKTDRAGAGYWVRNRVELLLIGTRGDVPAPAPGARLPQVIEAPRGRHSEKPAIFAELVEKLYPKLEMFARTQRAGWDSWGNEALAPMATGNAVDPQEAPDKSGAGNGVDPQESAQERKSAYAESETAADGLGIPPFLRRDGGAP